MGNVCADGGLLVALLTLLAVYVALGAVTSEILELIATITHMRAATMWKVIHRMPGSSDFAQKLAGHPLLRGVGNALPPYLSERDVTEAALDIMGPEITPSGGVMTAVTHATVPVAKAAAPSVAAARFALAPSYVSALLKKYRENDSDEVSLKLDAALAVERWFRSCVRESIARYRRAAVTALAVLGFVFAGIFNVDTLYIVQATAHATPASAQAGSIAHLPIGWHPSTRALAASTSGGATVAPPAKSHSELIPMGPEDDALTLHSLTFPAVWLKLLGFLITALGTATAGSSVFDIVGRFARVRLDAAPEDRLK